MAEPETFGPGKLCVGCGMCCRNYPGAYFPSDLGEDRETVLINVEAMLMSGWFSIDNAEIDDQTVLWFIRPRTLQGVREGLLIDPTYFGGTCTFLGPVGCRLPREDMPFACRALKPMETETGDCISDLDKDSYGRAWADYQADLIEIANRCSRALGLTRKAA